MSSSIIRNEGCATFQGKFENSANSLISSASVCFAITSSDSGDLPQPTWAIYIGTSGDVTLVAIGADEPVTFRNAIGGSIIGVRVRKILAAGTTAQDIMGLA